MKSKAKPAAKTAHSGKLKLAVQYASDAAEMPTRQQFRKWVKAALTRDAEITLRIVDEAEGRSLNRDFRGQRGMRRDYATNVLTFAYNETGDEVLELCGDIVLCAAVVEKEAKQQRKNLLAHYAHLTVHGILHLLGYDHENDADAAVMERLETEIVMKLGYDDPYNRG